MEQDDDQEEQVPGYHAGPAPAHGPTAWTGQIFGNQAQERGCSRPIPEVVPPRVGNAIHTHLAAGQGPGDGADGVRVAAAADG